MYQKVDEQAFQFLKELFGEDDVLLDPEMKEKYSHDEVPRLRELWRPGRSTIS